MDEKVKPIEFVIRKKTTEASLKSADYYEITFYCSNGDKLTCDIAIANLLHYHNLDIKIDKHYSITDIYGYVVSDDRKNF